MRNPVRRRLETALLAKALWTRGGRAWMAVVGVTVCTLLVVVLASTVRSVRGSIASYAGQKNVDLWVAPLGSDNLVRGNTQSTLIPDEIAAEILQIPGVRAAQPIVHAFLLVSAQSRSGIRTRASLIAVGFKTPTGLGGPPAYATGRPPSGSSEVALDRAAAYRLDVGVGDTVEIAGTRLTITGLTRRTNILATQFIFGDFKTASEAIGRPGWATFILVALLPGADASAIKRDIEARYRYTSVHTREAFVAANDREVMAGFLPLISLLAALGVCAGAVLVGLLVHGVVEARGADIAVLLALGAKASAVARAVIFDALGLVVAGVAGGSASAWLLAQALDRFAPAIPLANAWIDVAGAAVLFLSTGLAAALAPVARLQRVDPLEAFRP